MNNKAQDFEKGWEEFRTKKKQDIDELANDINKHCIDLNENYCGSINCVSCLARALNKQGYRKIDKDSVVLSREEYDEFLRQNFIIDELKDCVKLASKETAEKLYDKVMSFIGSNQKFWIVDEEHITIIQVDKLFDFVMETAKQFGVEIKEYGDEKETD